MQKLPHPGGPKQFLQVPLGPGGPQLTVAQALQGRTVIEYPTLFVSSREYFAGFRCLVQQCTADDC